MRDSHQELHTAKRLYQSSRKELKFSALSRENGFTWIQSMEVEQLQVILEDGQEPIKNLGF